MRNPKVSCHYAPCESCSFVLNKKLAWCSLCNLFNKSCDGEQCFISTVIISFLLFLFPFTGLQYSTHFPYGLWILNMFNIEYLNIKHQRHLHWLHHLFRMKAVIKRKIPHKKMYIAHTSAFALAQTSALYITIPHCWYIYSSVSHISRRCCI